ncbi:MAG: PilX N-terminal domain-containing pilus assembly protein [Candidatus Thiodiazotropha sp.]
MITGSSPRRNQSGAALVISLILLTIITLLSVSAMQNTNLETRIAVNHQFKELSFQAAENALSIITGPQLDALTLDIPAVIGDMSTTPDFFTAIGVTDQPDLSADIDMTYQDVIDPGKGQGNVLFSGYQPDVVTHLYLADAYGHVGASGTQTHNRMQVALIRQ